MGSGDNGQPTASVLNLAAGETRPEPEIARVPNMEESVRVTRDGMRRATPIHAQSTESGPIGQHLENVPSRVERGLKSRREHVTVKLMVAKTATESRN